MNADLKGVDELYLALLKTNEKTFYTTAARRTTACIGIRLCFFRLGELHKFMTIIQKHKIQSGAVKNHLSTPHYGIKNW